MSNRSCPKAPDCHWPHAWSSAESGLEWCTGTPLSLSGFLLARIAEELAEGGCGGPDAGCDTLSRKWLVECEAKTRIVTELVEAMDWDDSIREGATRTAVAGERVLSWLALPYADHPDYRQEWKA